MKAQQDSADFIRRALKSVPLPPRAVRELLRISQESDVEMQRIVDTITSDEALTARVIRVVNSALFGMKRKISSVQQATILLGREAIIQIAVGVTALHMETEASTELPLGRQSFWRHSMGTAFLARQISAPWSEVDGEQAFTAGLLHDIGKLVLMAYLGPEYAHVLQQAEQEERPLDEVEREMLGVDHDDIGRELCDKWKLSASLREAASLHRAAEPPNRLNRIVQVANAAAKAIGIGESGSHHVNLHRLAGREIQQAARDPEFIQTLPHEVARIEQAFRVQADQETEETSSGAREDVRGIVLVQVQNETLEALLTIALCGLGFTPRRLGPDTKGSSMEKSSAQPDPGIVGGIIDGRPPSQSSDARWLNVASWRRHRRNDEEEIVNLTALRTWLSRELKIHRSEKA